MKTNTLTKLAVVSLLLISPLVYTSATQNVLPISEGKNLQNESLPKLDAPRVQLTKAENQERRCELVTQRIADKIARYKNLEKRHQGIYLGLGNKLENLVNRLKEDGYTGENITALETDMTKLDELSEKLKANYSDYLAKLEELKSASCEDSDINFTQALKTAREELAATREVIQEIKDFYLTEVKPHIAAMREQIKEEKLNREQNEKPENETTDTEEEQD